MLKRSTLLSFVFVAATSSVHAAGSLVDRPDIADLVYDPQTGIVTLDATEFQGPILTFFLQNETDAFNTANTVFPFIDTGTNTSNTPSEIGQVDPLALGFDGRHTLGPIFPVEFSPNDLTSLLTIAGFNGFDGVGHDFDIVVIPEPSAWFLTMFCLPFFVRAISRSD